MAKKKSWREKLDDAKDLPKLIDIPERMQPRLGKGTMVIPAPREVDAIMRRVPEGRLITINEIRTELAKKHGAAVACPITTGIFAWIAANAADEAASEGKRDGLAYWRTLKAGGELNPKYPGGIERLKRKLREEGHRIVAKGKRFVVADYSDHLVKRAR
ncbi:MAG: hypothetical protein DMF61_16135 [Blastocatellia bacterium AA13]|nr:MAG: hypothetical protein DMF61_16135 [Blastocatellia bacterium AA13]